MQVQRGTIIQLAGAMAGEVPMPGMLGMPMPGMPIPVRSIIMLVIRVTPFPRRDRPVRPALVRTSARSSWGEYTHERAVGAIIFFHERSDLPGLR